MEAQNILWQIVPKSQETVGIDELKSHLFLVHFSVCFSFENG